MKASTYASALARLSDAVTADKAVKGLLASLKTTGRMKLLPAILREMKRAEARKLATIPRVEVSRDKDAKKALAAAQAAGVEVKDVLVNPELLSGWRVRGNGQLLDQSGKRHLLDLYRKITS